MRVAIYCRVSCDHEENIRSLENQILAYIELVQNNPGWILKGIYSDKGVSGTSMNRRVGFQRLLRHCEQGRIDLVITKSLSRFSRNTHDLLGVLRQLRKQHVDVIFEKEGIRMSEADNEFILTLYAAVAQQEAVNVSQNIGWSFRKKALQGKPYVRSLYGYKAVKHGNEQALEIIPYEAETVRNIFASYLSGTSIAGIIRMLAEEGIETKTGQQVWNATTIKGILGNEKYTGNTRVVPKPSKMADLRIESLTDTGEIFIQNSHPPIIDGVTFSQVQNKLKESHKKIVQKPKSKLVLTGRIICGHCGTHYAIFYAGKIRQSFACVTYRKNRASCPGKPVWESQVIEILRQAYLTRFQSSDDQSMTLLRELVEKSCDLEEAEAQRLAKIIEISRVGQALLASPSRILREKKEHLARDFIEFEKDIELAERDYDDRVALAAKLTQFSSVDRALQEMTLSNLCAIIPEMVLYSPVDATVRWVDHKMTAIGQIHHGLSPVYEMAPNEKNEQESLPDPDIITASTKAVIARTTMNTSHPWLAANSDQSSTLRVCAYCRTSSAEERHIQSLARQVATYTHLIMTNPNYTFAGIYVDHGKSGLRTKGREGFQQMINDAKDGKFDLILTKSVARFGRNTVDILQTVRTLRGMPKPVIVCFENESIRSDSSQCDFMLSLHAALAQNEAESNSANVRWGVVNTLMQGTFQHPGSMPYGYRKESDGNWSINPDQAAIIRQIYADYIGGLTPYRIASKLRESKVLTGRNNTKWTTASVYRMVRNEIYIGNYIYRKNYKPDALADRTRTNNGAADKYYIENHHPAIIDPETWHNANLSTQQRSKKRSERKSNSIDSSKSWRKVFCDKLFCSSCGHKAVHILNKKNGIPYYYWRCSAASLRNPAIRCHSPLYRQEWLEHAFMIFLKNMKTDDFWKNPLLEYTNNLSAAINDLEQYGTAKKKQLELYRKIHDCVQVERSEHIQMIEQITRYTEEVLEINASLEEFDHTRKQNKELLIFLRSLSCMLEEIPDFNPTQNRITFRFDLFTKMVRRVELINKTTVLFHLLFNCTMSISIFGYFPHRLSFT